MLYSYIQIVQESTLDIEKIICNVDRPSISDVVFVNPTGIDNAIIMVNGYYARYRAEMIVNKDNKFYSYISHNRVVFPGGSVDRKDSDPINAAVRETQEEARINTKNVRYIGNYVIVLDKPKEWVAKKIPKEYQWKAYYSEVYISDYDSKYTGKVAKDDVDNDMMNLGKWHTIGELRKYANKTQLEAMKLSLK